MKDLKSANCYWVAALAVIALSVFVYIFNSKPDINGDNCYYYANASSLAAGDGYSDMFGNPTTNFPPGYPLLMAPLRMITDSIVAQKVLNLSFFFAGTLFLFFLLLENGVRRVVAFLSCAAVLLTPHILEFSTMMMSEASCFCCIAMVLWLFQRIPMYDGRGVCRSPFFYGFLVALVFGFFIRTQMIVLVVAFVLTFLFMRRMRLSLAVIIAFLVGYLPWFLRNAALNLTQSRYVTQIDFSNIFATLKMLLVQAVPESVIPFVNVQYNEEPSLHMWLYSILLISVIVYGFCKLERLRLPLIIFCFATFGVVSCINTPSTYRYIITILPLLTVGLFVGLWNVCSAIYVRVSNKELSPWFLALLFISIPLQWGDTSKHTIAGLHNVAVQDYAPQLKSFVMAGKALKHYDENAVVATRKPEILYVCSDVKGKHFAETEDDVKLIKSLVDGGVNYVMVDEMFFSTFKYIIPCIKRHSELFSPLLRVPDSYTMVFSFKKDEAEIWLDSMASAKE